MKTKLSDERQKHLNQQKRATRVNNEVFFRAHPELRVMVSAFLTGLLEDKPGDIPAYAADFFTDPQLARKLGFVGWSRPETPQDDIFDDRPETPGFVDDDFPPDEPAAAVTGESVQDLEEILIGLFKEADQDGNGTLDHDEFIQLMETADLGIKKQELHLLLAEADENSDQKISYAEFVPLAVEVVQMIRLKSNVQDVEEYATEELRAAADYSAPSDQKLQSAVLGSAAPDGTITRPVLKQALSAGSLGLSKQVVSIVANAAISAVSADAAEVASDIRGHLLDAITTVLGMQNLDSIGEELDRILSKADADNTGTLDPRVLKDVLARNYPPLTRLQLAHIVNDSPVDDNARVLYQKYSPRLAMMIKAMLDPSTINERIEMMDRAEFLPLQLMNGREQAEMEQMLKSLFQEHDVDGNGFLDRTEFETCLQNSELGLDKSEIDLLIDTFDANADGMMSYTEFCDMAYEVLVSLAREKAIMEMYLTDPE